MTRNAVLALRQRLMAESQRPYRARGATCERCQGCLTVVSHCSCRYQLPQQTQVDFCLVMHRKEPLKPTNTGRLIADILPDTSAFIWDRTEPDPAMLAVLQDPNRQPYLVFPGEYIDQGEVLAAPRPWPEGKRPLFVLLDATWAQARKIYFKSPYLQTLPVLSIDPDRLSNYRLREAAHQHQLATAEVAAMVLELAGEPDAADVLDAYFQVFSQRYYAGKHQLDAPVDGDPFQRLSRHQPQ
ncbi:tRNA-uridine aminocarboxypropyltransferase [Ferrimonas kyonanensis]|uniref:tRNA-uridine aminocarboxypropyltransferase n=1 Tax=Ferrimonas kyonanensis TaxID=364763 RepID=UPI0004258C64|nr:tRNA-uridine aminocarboxypropyltransferase [Ferrimonas kyonanensis]